MKYRDRGEREINFSWPLWTKRIRPGPQVLLRLKLSWTESSSLAGYVAGIVSRNILQTIPCKPSCKSEYSDRDLQLASGKEKGGGGTSKKQPTSQDKDKPHFVF